MEIDLLFILYIAIPILCTTNLDLSIVEILRSLKSGSV